MSLKSKSRRLSLERLEARQVLSLTIDLPEGILDGLAGDALEVGEAKGGGKTSGPTIDLPTVVAHELGHSLGLPHSTDPSCGTANQPIMCPYYIGAAFRLAAEDVQKIRAAYPDNSVVQNAADGRWDDPDITFSFMPDGTSIDQGGRKGSELFAVMQKAIGSNWQEIFRQALVLWAEATDAEGIPDLDLTDNALQFTEVSDHGAPFNFTGNGSGQGDAGAGDIRFGSHKFDGPGGVLAHAYFPPPNGASAAGDAHFAKEENWRNLSGLNLSTGTSGLTFAENQTSPRGSSRLGGAAVAARVSQMQFAFDPQEGLITPTSMSRDPSEVPAPRAHDAKRQSSAVEHYFELIERAEMTRHDGVPHNAVEENADDDSASADLFEAWYEALNPWAAI